MENRVSLLVKEKSSLLSQVAAAERKVTGLDKRNGVLELQVINEIPVGLDQQMWQINTVCQSMLGEKTIQDIYLCTLHNLAML